MTDNPDDDPKLIITVEEAISVLSDDDTVHNFAQAGPMLIGVDYDRDQAIDALRGAIQIEISGPAARGMGHGLAVWSDKTSVSFFEADPEKLDALERAKLEGVDG
jgi:hypothetical protein